MAALASIVVFLLIHQDSSVLDKGSKIKNYWMNKFSKEINAGEVVRTMRNVEGVT